VKLGLIIGYWSTQGPAAALALTKEADRLGYDVVWSAEAYGSDAVTVLGWLAAQTERIELGTGIMQIPARTPAMTAMTAATLDTLSGGRFRLGLGVSGPQVSEGWHGVRFAKPLARTREYVDIVRMAMERKRVRYDGQTYQLPLPDGPGKALFLMIHPVRQRVPIYLAAIGPKNLELAGEIADGLLPVFFAPSHSEPIRAALEAGRAKVGKTLEGFDIAPTVPLVVGDDVQACADPVRPYAALYVGGMGSREQNFYNDLACRMGFVEEAAEVQRRYLAREPEGAAAAVPFEFIDQTSLLGPTERLARRMADFAAAGVTTLNVSPAAGTLDQQIAALRVAMVALHRSGVAG
jgi:F420-dependent oxidoreductase-like protein